MDSLTEYSLPGVDLIVTGISALEQGEHTNEALVLALSPTRLRELGLKIPEAVDMTKEPNALFGERFGFASL